MTDDRRQMTDELAVKIQRLVEHFNFNEKNVKPRGLLAGPSNLRGVFITLLIN